MFQSPLILKMLLHERCHGTKTHWQAFSKVLKMDPAYRDLEGSLKYLGSTLLEIDEDNTKSPDIIEEQTEKIKEVLHAISNANENIWLPLANPIHELLDIGPLKRSDIPLEVIEGLISIGFDVNEVNEGCETCLYVAIKHRHYNVVRLLITNGAKCIKYEGIANTMYSYDSYDSEDEYQSDNNPGDYSSPATLLAAQENAPLDLFDLLATQQSLNACDHNSDSVRLPLHTAAEHGHTKIAKHLIKFGASVNQLEQSKYLPIYNFMLQDNNFSDELFTSLLPSKPGGINVLMVIGRLLEQPKEKLGKTKLEVLHQLIQRLHFSQSLLLKIMFNALLVELVVNGENVFSSLGLQAPYLCCLMTVTPEFDVVLVDCSIVPDSKRERDFISAQTDIMGRNHQQCNAELRYVSLIQKLCKMDSQKRHVKSLLRLCIL